MAQAAISTGAEKVRWNLSDLYSGPDDPQIEVTLSQELERAMTLESQYKGKVATLAPGPFAAMMAELAEH